MTLALLLFAAAAIAGVVMAAMRFRERPYPPMALALAHGLVAATGLVVLLVMIAGGPAASLHVVALVLLLAAALGGFLLFAKHIQKKELPIGLMLIHAVVAVVGFLALLLGTLL